MNFVAVFPIRCLVKAMSTLHISLLASFLIFLSSSTTQAAPQLFSRPGDKTKAPEKKVEDTGKEAEALETKSVLNEPITTTSKKLAGHGKFIAGKDGWVLVTGASANANFQLPVEPKFKTVEFSPIQGRPPITHHMYKSVISPKQTVIFSWHDLHEAPVGRKQIKDTLEGTIKGNVALLLGRMNGEVKEIKVGGYPAREFNFEASVKIEEDKEQVFRATCQAVLAGKRLYQMHVVTEAGSEDPVLAKRAFDSITIK